MQTYGKHDNNQQVLWFVAFCGAANIPKSSRLPFHGLGFSGSGFRLRICPSFWIRPNIRTTPLPSNPPESESQELHSALLVLRPQPFEPYSPKCHGSLLMKAASARSSFHGATFFEGRVIQLCNPHASEKPCRQIGKPCCTLPDLSEAQTSDRIS